MSECSLIVANLAHEHLLSYAEREERFSKLLKFNGLKQLPNVRVESFLEQISRTVAGQQLSTKAADTIWARVEGLHKSFGSTFDNFIINQSDIDLRQCGLSRAKIRTIRGLVDGAMDGQLDTRSLVEMDHLALTSHLTSFWGIGLWTAEMMAIFFFHSPDVWSKGDVGLKNSLSFLFSDEKKKLKLVDRAAPYRSYLSLHLWAGLDEGFYNLDIDGC